jgi:APA family basic amino acid/polyamine antiporter
MDKKALSLPLLISLVVGNMIGTGIYVLPAALAQYGTLSILSWGITSLGALFLALTFANLSKRFPKTGGPYVYCKEAFGRVIGFLVAYLYWISNLVSIAGITVSSVSYLGFIYPSFNFNTADYNFYYVLMTELSLIWVFTFINIIGIHTAGVVQLCLTIIKMTPLILVIVVGFGHIHLNNLTQFTINQPANLSTISAAAALTFWAFIGLEAATIPAENTQGYRDIFKATVYGTLIVALIYILCTFVLMGMIPVTQLKNSSFPFAEAGILLFGPNAALLIAMCAVISGIGALNVCILIQGQIVFAAARDHLFPKQFATLTKHDVPIWGQLLSSALVTLFLIMTMQPSILKQFDHIALLAALLTLATYFITTLAEIKFIVTSQIEKKVTSKKSLRKMLLNKPITFAFLAGIYSIWMISSLECHVIIMGILMVLCCIPISFFIIKKDTVE